MTEQATMYFDDKCFLKLVIFVNFVSHITEKVLYLKTKSEKNKNKLYLLISDILVAPYLLLYYNWKLMLKHGSRDLYPTKRFMNVKLIPMLEQGSHVNIC